MKYSFSILILILLVWLPFISTDKQPLDAGETSAWIEDFPWQVVVRNRKEDNLDICGGFVNSGWFVMTAAHCFDKERSDIETATVGLGVKNGYDLLTRNVSQLFIHPMYRIHNDYIEYDIAILELNQDVKFSERVQPISFPMTKIDNLHVYPARVSGFGKYGSNKSSSFDNFKYFLYCILKKMEVILYIYII